MRQFFQFTAIILHPLILSTLVLLVFFNYNPFLLGYSSISQGGVLVIYTFVLTFLMPVVGILLLKGTGLIKSLTMEDKMERVGPLIIVNIFYLWFFINCKNNTQVPLEYTVFVFAALICLLLSFVINLFVKISLHAAGWSALTCFFIIHYFYTDNSIFDAGTLFSLTIVSLLLLGFISTGRLYLRAHNGIELISGIILGIVAQIISFIILL